MVHYMDSVQRVLCCTRPCSRFDIGQCSVGLILVKSFFYSRTNDCSDDVYLFPFWFHKRDVLTQRQEAKDEILFVSKRCIHETETTTLAVLTSYGSIEETGVASRCCVLALLCLDDSQGMGAVPDITPETPAISVRATCNTAEHPIRIDTFKVQSLPQRWIVTETCKFLWQGSKVDRMPWMLQESGMILQSFEILISRET